MRPTVVDKRPRSILADKGPILLDNIPIELRQNVIISYSSPDKSKISNIKGYERTEESWKKLVESKYNNNLVITFVPDSDFYNTEIIETPRAGKFLWRLVYGRLSSNNYELQTNDTVWIKLMSGRLSAADNPNYAELAFDKDPNINITDDMLEELIEAENQNILTVIVSRLKSEPLEGRHIINKLVNFSANQLNNDSLADILINIPNLIYL